MVYVIIVLALLFIIVPIVAVLPSVRQKEQMVMRKVARQAGVIVDLATIDDPNPRQEKYISATGRPVPPNLKVIAYRLHRQRERTQREQPRLTWCIQKREASQQPVGARDVPKEGGSYWHWVTGPVEKRPLLRDWVEAAVGDLPHDVEQVEESNQLISVYWHERENGSESAVIDFLKQCASLPLSQADADPDDGV